MIDRASEQLERFITTGIDEAQIKEIGDLPRGRGILGVLIHESAPLRLQVHARLRHHLRQRRH